MKVGDTVVLKSGESPKMTITKLTALVDADDNPYTVVDLMWFGVTPDERPGRLDWIDIKTLRKAKDDE